MIIPYFGKNVSREKVSWGKVWTHGSSLVSLISLFNVTCSLFFWPFETATEQIGPGPLPRP